MDADATRLIYDYSFSATGRVLKAARRLDDGQFSATPTLAGAQSLQHILVHMLDTEIGWREVLKADSPENSPPDLELAQFPDIETLAARWQDEEAIMREWLSSLDDDRLQAMTFAERPLWLALYHLANHSTQHRSEAAMVLTAFGCSPGDLDMVFYLRGWQDR